MSTSMSTSNDATLSVALASKLARIALAHVEREYPSKLDHVLTSATDVQGPRALHAVFYGSFDWHSCVHGYWLLATLLRRFPDFPEAAAIHILFERQFRQNKVAAEVAYLSAPGRAGFERPYGWAWLLMLSAELARPASPDAARAGRMLQPLADAIVARFTEFLPKATYPVRVGTHFNTAFALSLALDYADVMRNEDFSALLREKARTWYMADADYQAWEPGGDDFLSSALIEAECMRRALPADEFARWMVRFLPRIAQCEPAALFTPAAVSDRSDGKIAHLDGLNLSRAWCWRSLASSWAEGDPRRAIADSTAAVHVAASLPHVAGDYMGEHWLGTFVVLALAG
jgi:hypothetical protein